MDAILQLFCNIAVHSALNRFVQLDAPFAIILFYFHGLFHLGLLKKISRKARPTEQTGSVRRQQQCHSKNRNVASMWVAKVATLERKRGPSLTPALCVARRAREKGERTCAKLAKFLVTKLSEDFRAETEKQLL